MSALLGDFNFNELYEADNVLGPFFFIFFIGIAVFVVLNMIIAIISDAYEQAREELADAPPVDILDEIKMFLLTKLYRNYVGRKLVKLFCKASYKRIFDVQNKDLEADAHFHKLIDNTLRRSSLRRRPAVRVHRDGLHSREVEPQLNSMY